MDSPAYSQNTWYVAEQTLDIDPMLNQCKARKRPRPIVPDDQQSGKDEDKLYFWEGLVDFSASCPNREVEI